MGGDTWTGQPPTTRRNRETLIGMEEATCGLKSSTDDHVTQALAAPAQVGEHIDALLIDTNNTKGMGGLKIVLDINRMGDV